MNGIVTSAYLIAFIEEVPRVCFLVAMTCAIGIIVGYPAAHWIGAKVGEILSCLPTDRFAKAPPALGIPASKAVRGDFDGAIEDYEKLLIDHPGEKEIYFRLLEITLGPMHMEQYGGDVLRRGLEKLTCETERTALLKYAEAIRRGDYTPLRHFDHHPAEVRQQFT